MADKNPPVVPPEDKDPPVVPPEDKDPPVATSSTTEDDKHKKYIEEVLTFSWDDHNKFLTKQKKDELKKMSPDELSNYYRSLFTFKEAMYLRHYIKENLKLPKVSGGYVADGAPFDIKFIYKHSEAKTIQGSFKVDGEKKISFIKETILDHIRREDDKIITTKFKDKIILNVKKGDQTYNLLSLHGSSFINGKSFDLFKLSKDDLIEVKMP